MPSVLLIDSLRELCLGVTRRRFLSTFFSPISCVSPSVRTAWLEYEYATVIRGHLFFKKTNLSICFVFVEPSKQFNLFLDFAIISGLSRCCAALASSQGLCEENARSMTCI